MADDPSDETKVRLIQAVALAAMMKTDTDVRKIVTGVLIAQESESIGQLAMLKPEVFDELYEIVNDLIDQMPTYKAPGFSR